MTDDDVTLDQYPYRWSFPTRWNDNDAFGHVNNTIYYAAMDTAVTSWFAESFHFDPLRSPWIAVIVSSSCHFRVSAVFPDVIEVGVRAGRLGRSSISWELALFRRSDGALLATGEFVHVVIERDSTRPVEMPAELRAALEATVVAPQPTPAT